MNIVEIENLFLEAIGQVQIGGWTIDSEIYINDKEKCCCPIGALIICHDYDRDVFDEQIVSDARCILGLTRAEIDSFVIGFDNLQLKDWDLDLRGSPELWALGKNLRNKFIDGCSFPV